MTSEKLKPEIRCIYQSTTVYGIPYCSIAEVGKELVECPYLSQEKVKTETYSAIYGGTSKMLEFRICNFEWEVKR